MSNRIGSYISFTLFGESHGAEIGVLADGLPAGIPVDEDFIKKQLSRRRPVGAISTARVESDEYRIVSGVFGGYTTGAPLCLLIPNSNTDSKSYEGLTHHPRPGHADYTALVKYGGYSDYRGGGHFSGRLTAALTAMGALVQSALKAKGVEIGAHISTIGDIKDKSFTPSAEEFALSAQDFPVIDKAVGEKMKAYIAEAAAEGDSVGGIIELAVTGVPAGVGEPWFDGVENALARAMFGIPAVKGIEFGAGFDFARLKGSTANDLLQKEQGRVVTKTNNNGGINGGISNGMPVIYRLAIKPTPSIYKEQNTLNLKADTVAPLQIHGRHDPAIIHRAVPVTEAVSALVFADLLAQQYGRAWLVPVKEEK